MFKAYIHREAVCLSSNVEAFPLEVTTPRDSNAWELQRANGSPHSSEKDHREIILKLSPPDTLYKPLKSKQMY